MKELSEQFQFFGTSRDRQLCDSTPEKHASTSDRKIYMCTLISEHQAIP